MRQLQKVMESVEVYEAIRQIQPGEIVEIQFKETDMADLAYLQGMHKRILTVDTSDFTTLLAIRDSGSWGVPTNRIFLFKVEDTWKTEDFIRLFRRIESIRVLPPEEC